MEVLVTGATGTIGSAVVPRLLQRADAVVHVLVRAGDPSDLAARIDGLRRHWGFAENDARLSRLRPVRGDVSQPRLGIDAPTFEAWQHSLTHIVHCAASVKLNMSPEEARATAVAPTREIVGLARQCAKAGKLRKLELVSTVGVWGRTPGEMPERPLPDVTDFHNTYEAAKSEAERFAFAEAADLPLTVHRPSMVVGERGSGRVIHFQVFYHLCEFLSGGRTFGVMPPLGTRTLDTVPVDWVADAIVWSALRTDGCDRILHLCSGPAAVGLDELRQLVRTAWSAHGRPTPRLHTVPRRWLEAAVPLLGALAGEKTRRALRGLPPVLAYLEESQSFGNAQTARLLAAASLPVPAPRDYLPAVLGHYLTQRYAARP